MIVVMKIYNSQMFC